MTIEIDKYLNSILTDKKYYMAYSVGSAILKVPHKGVLDYQDIYSRGQSLGASTFMRHCAVFKIIDTELWEDENLNE